MSISNITEMKMIRNTTPKDARKGEHRGRDPARGAPLQCTLVCTMAWGATRGDALT